MLRSAHHPHTEHPQGCSVCGWWAKAVPVCDSEGQRFFVVLAPSDVYVEHGWAMAKNGEQPCWPRIQLFFVKVPKHVLSLYGWDGVVGDVKSMDVVFVLMHGLKLECGNVYCQKVCKFLL